MPRYSKLSLSFRFHHENLLWISLLPQPCHMPLTSHSPWSGLPNDIFWTALITNILIIWFPPSPLTSSHLHPNIFLSTPSLNITTQSQQTEFSIKYLFEIWFLFACFDLNNSLKMTSKSEIQEPHKIKYPKMVAHNFFFSIIGTIRLTTGWTVRDRIQVGKRFSARPDRPWGPPSLLYNGYRVFPGVEAAGACCWPLTPF